MTLIQLAALWAVFTIALGVSAGWALSRAMRGAR
jgi:hypothetical protein